jgi:hypothetical protein
MISSGLSVTPDSHLDETRGRSSSTGSIGDERFARGADLVYKGKKGQGMIHEKTLIQMSPPLSRSISSLRLDEPSSSGDIDTLNLENHLILCYLGRNIFPKSLLFFIEPFRKMNPDIPVVILSSMSPSSSDRLVLDQYDLIFVNGNPLDRQALVQCGVKNCSIAVVTGNNRTEMSVSVDSSTLLCVVNIEALCRNPGRPRPLLTIRCSNSVGCRPYREYEVRWSKDEGKTTGRFILIASQSFIRIGESLLTRPSEYFAGAFCFLTLKASTYYNPFLVMLIRKLVFPSDNRILHFPVSEYAGMCWSTVFEIFLKNGIPLGLYKHREGTEREFYVIVNPPSRMPVGRRDAVMMIVPL